MMGNKEKLIIFIYDGATQKIKTFFYYDHETAIKGGYTFFYFTSCFYFRIFNKNKIIFKFMGSIS